MWTGSLDRISSPRLSQTSLVLRGPNSPHLLFIYLFIRALSKTNIGHFRSSDPNIEYELIRHRLPLQDHTRQHVRHLTSGYDKYFSNLLVWQSYLPTAEMPVYLFWHIILSAAAGCVNCWFSAFVSRFRRCRQVLLLRFKFMQLLSAILQLPEIRFIKFVLERWMRRTVDLYNLVAAVLMELYGCSRTGWWVVDHGCCCINHDRDAATAKLLIQELTSHSTRVKSASDRCKNCRRRLPQTIKKTPVYYSPWPLCFGQ